MAEEKWRWSEVEDTGRLTDVVKGHGLSRVMTPDIANDLESRLIAATEALRAYVEWRDFDARPVEEDNRLYEAWERKLAEALAILEPKEGVRE